MFSHFASLSLIGALSDQPVYAFCDRAGSLRILGKRRSQPSAVNLELECLAFCVYFPNHNAARFDTHVALSAPLLRILGKRRLPIRPPFEFELPTT